MNNIIKIHTEFCMVSNASIKSDTLYERIHDILPGLEAFCKRKNINFPSFYHNHFVLECENGIMIGIHDGMCYIGTEIFAYDSSKSIEVDVKLPIL